MTRRSVPAGAPWGEALGYSRAVRVGDTIYVSGTSASGPDGKALHPNDPGKQTEAVLAKIAAALTELGASLADVVETRIFVTDIARWEEVGRAHGAAFKDIRPATTLVATPALVAPDLLVEIAATAVVRG